MEPKTTEEKQKQLSLLRVLILLVPLLVLFWWITGGPVPSRGVEKARLVSCMTDLESIETAKRQWAVDRGVTNAGTPVPFTSVVAYFRRGPLRANT